MKKKMFLSVTFIALLKTASYSQSSYIQQKPVII